MYLSPVFNAIFLAVKLIRNPYFFFGLSPLFNYLALKLKWLAFPFPLEKNSKNKVLLAWKGNVNARKLSPLWQRITSSQNTRPPNWHVLCHVMNESCTIVHDFCFSEWKWHPPWSELYEREPGFKASEVVTVDHIRGKNLRISLSIESFHTLLWSLKTGFGRRVYQSWTWQNDRIEPNGVVWGGTQ